MHRGLRGRGLAQKSREGQFETSAVIAREETRVSHVWEAVLAARGQACAPLVRSISAIRTRTVSVMSEGRDRVNACGARRRVERGQHRY